MSKIVVIDLDELEQRILAAMRKVLLENKEPTKSDDEIMDADEACKMLHMAKQTLYTMTSQRRVPFMKIGKRLLFRRRELQQWLTQNKRKTVQEIMEE